MSPILLSHPLAHADPRPLEYIRSVHLNETFLAVLEKCGAGATLKRIDYVRGGRGDLIGKLGELAPGLEWLCFSYDPKHIVSFCLSLLFFS